MKFGIQISCHATSWDQIKTSIETLEAGRWNSVWFSDHILPPLEPRDDESLTAWEGYTLLAVAAGMTKRLKLGHLVLGNPYRNPGWLANMAATFDHASKGRFILGLGAGWFKREYEAYGLGVFPSMKERQDRLQEACELIRMLFTSDGPVDYKGQYYSLDKAPLSPGCYQKPHIPILVGGTGEKRTLRTLAMHGDIFNLDGWGGSMTFELYQHKISVLEQHCENVGRDPSEIKHTLMIPLHITNDKASQEAFIKLRGEGSMTGPLNEIIGRIGKFVEAGVDEIMFGNIPNGDVEAIQRVEEEVVTVFG
jgi:alkanesulfonate monooxygenase SsuD/methylene tetrahydromethanopterin reductase-like flavin-dependent oxidoreductase (luciferase family)